MKENYSIRKGFQEDSFHVWKIRNSPSVRAQSNTIDAISFKADILPTNGHPVVYAENLSAGEGKPTVLIYGHYDVQDPGNIDEWSSEPFKPEIRSGNIYGRGVADDKGQFYTWIAAIDQLGKLPMNVKFLVKIFIGHWWVIFKNRIVFF